jgi:hypothetical protein
MYENLLVEVEILKSALVNFSTGGNAENNEYKELRERLLRSKIVGNRLPQFLKTCRSLDEF